MPTSETTSSAKGFQAEKQDAMEAIEKYQLELASEINAKYTAFLSGKPILQGNQLAAATQAMSEDMNRPFGYITNLEGPPPTRDNVDPQDMAEGKKLTKRFIDKNPELKEIAAKYQAAEKLKAQLFQVNNEQDLAAIKTNAQKNLAIIATSKDTAGLGILASIKSLFNRLGLSFSAKKEEPRINIKRAPLFRPHEEFIARPAESRESIDSPERSSTPKPGQR